MLARSHSLALALLALANVLASATVPAAGNSGGVAYRWVDENGVVHYGDRVPPQYATKESALLNKQGVEVGRTEAQRSPEQIAEDERKRQEMLRQKQHDAFLLTTYTSVKDIESLRDERLFQIGGQRRAAEQYVEGLHSRLNGLQARARNFKPYSDNPDARRMPDDLAEDLVRTLNEMRTQRNALAAKDAEENTLRQQFQADIERYRELRKPVTR
jgi:Domain of unknown function (DUF4124)